MKILITGVGGMVGQGVLKNIRRSFGSQFTLIGTDTREVNIGIHLCDKSYRVEPAYQDFVYCSQIKEIVKKEDIKLILPTTDAEAYYLSRFRDQLDCPVAVSPSEVTWMGFNKFKNSEWFKYYGIPFAETCMVKDYKGEFESIIVKPNEGKGSKDIHINPKDLTEFNNVNYILQELLTGDELTISFYVKKNGDLHGFIVFRRELQDGYTARAEVTFEYNDQVESLINKMLSYIPFRGSINVQAKVQEGKVIPFEINTRFSGTNSIRSRFGFADVKYTIQEYLLNEDPTPVHLLNGCAMRVINDIIYIEETLNDINNESEYYIF